MATVNTTLYGWSWGEAQFDWTTVGPFKVRILTPPPTAAPIPKQPQNPNSDQTTSEYTASNCGAYDIGSSSGDKNILGAASAAAQGFDVIAQRFDPQPKPKPKNQHFILRLDPLPD